MDMIQMNWSHAGKVSQKFKWVVVMLLVGTMSLFSLDLTCVKEPPQVVQKKKKLNIDEPKH